MGSEVSNMAAKLWPCQTSAYAAPYPCAGARHMASISGVLAMSIFLSLLLFYRDCTIQGRPMILDTCQPNTVGICSALAVTEVCCLSAWSLRSSTCFVGCQGLLQQ